VRSHAEWSGRFAHVAVRNAAGQFILAGGTEMDYAVLSQDGAYEYTQHTYLNDVWKSKDNGSTWSKVPARSDRWVPRRGHAAVMDTRREVTFILGGLCGSGCYLNDVWSAQRVDVWTSHGRAPWSARHGHAVVTVQKRVHGLVLLGGHDGKNFLNDVWTITRPTQALEWEQLGHARWAPRYGHAAVEQDGSLIVLGGLLHEGLTVACRGDVWRSDDGGTTWIEIHRHAFPPRYQHAAAVVHGVLWVMGGVDTELQRLNDVWRSSGRDGPLGVAWEALTPVAPWPPRYEFASAVAGDQLFLFGGLNDRDHRFHDVWRLDRTCADNVVCPGGTSCREIQNEPTCVDVCVGACPGDTKCVHDEDLQPLCTDPCESYQCPKDHSCYVAHHQPLCKRALPND